MKKAYLLVFAAIVALSFVAGRHSVPAPAHAKANERRVLYWIDPMHPSYKSDKPGIAPDCGMQLEPVYADAAGNAMVLSSGSVSLDAQQIQLGGIATVAVEKTSGTRTLRVPARVVADDTRSFSINAGADGFIRETFQDSVGTRVKKDQKLASFYAPEFLTVAGGYISTTERNPGNATQTALLGTQNWADRLRNLGMSDAQIKELGETRKIPDSVYIVAPVDGFIISRKISSGMRFDRGMEFYRVADLSHVWIVASVVGDDAQYFKPGAVAHVHVAGEQRAIAARVSQTLPQVDPSARTVQVRLEADNPGFELRPDMYVDVELAAPAPTGLSVPVDAILGAGMSQRVFVDHGNGTFEPRQVETGAQFGDRVQILKGLQEGDRVVSAGTFLVDSESRLRATAMTAMPMPSEKEQDDSDQQKVPSLKMIKAAESVDPSCGMKVKASEAAAAGHSLTYRGTTYYFCSSQCKSDFEKSPEKYLAAAHVKAGILGERSDQ